MLPDLASKMLVVVRDYHMKDDSFIKLGPLQSLRERCGDQSIFILNDDETGLTPRSSKGLRADVLRDRLLPVINERMAATRERTTFDRARNGHIIKFLVGLIQEFGGLTADEMRVMLAAFGVEKTSREIDSMLLCAEAAKWVAREQRGFYVYFFALPNEDALTIRFKKGDNLFNKGRRRQEFRDHWKKNDQQRASGISKFAGGGL
jgi:hypothetical protein